MFPKAKKSFGQNFLADPSVVRRIIQVAEIQPGESVLEIGPGTGVLTYALVAAGAKVTAVEADHDLIAPLQERFGDKIELIEGDIFNVRHPEEVNPTKGPSRDPSASLRMTDGNYKLVANIPYNITSQVLEHFLTTEPRPSRLVLMVQKEVADRITAKPGDMSLLSVVCQLYADVRRAFIVPRGAFRPIPKVDSAVVVLAVRGKVEGRNSKFEKRLKFEDLSHKPSSLKFSSNFEFRPSTLEPVIFLAAAGFSSRRKQLHNNIASAGFASSTRVREVLREMSLPETSRAQELSPAHWVELRARL